MNARERYEHLRRGARLFGYCWRDPRFEVTDEALALRERHLDIAEEIGGLRLWCMVFRWMSLTRDCPELG